MSALFILIILTVLLISFKKDSEMPSWIYIFYIFLLTITSVLGISMARARMREKMNFYQRQAVKRNGIIEGGGFSSVPRLNLMDDGKTISIYEKGGGKNSPLMTCIRRELEIGGSVRIIVSKEDVFSRIGKSMGLREFRVGNPRFDDSFLIRGSDEFTVLNLLTDEIQDQILRWKDHSPWMRIEKNVFEFVVLGSLLNDEEFDRFVEAGMAIIGKAKSLCRGGEMDYHAGGEVTQGEAVQAMPVMYGESAETRSKGRTAIVVGLALIALLIAGYYYLAGLNKGDPKGPGETIRYGVRYLLSDNNERLILATGNGDISTVRDLLEKGANPNTTDDNSGWSALMWASWKGRADIVKLLLDNGAEVNAKKTTALITALLVASRAGHAEVVKLLLDRGADVNVKATSDGSTALIIASWYGRTGVVRLLLDKGADVDSKAKFDNAEWTALKSAKKNGHRDIVQLLEKAGAKE